MAAASDVRDSIGARPPALQVASIGSTLSLKSWSGTLPRLSWPWACRSPLKTTLARFSPPTASPKRPKRR
eukprot:12419363-Karenia_brevis.AAC.1